jgi:hypothetical protein
MIANDLGEQGMVFLMLSLYEGLPAPSYFANLFP